MPTVFYFCGLHEDYHRPSDDPHTIDADKAARVARASLGVILHAANRDDRLDFERPVSGDRGGNDGASASPTARRTLGVYESPTASGNGFSVSGVVEGSVADKAGVLAGDRIVRVGTSAVGNASDLRKALQEMKSGKAFEIEVVRNEEKIVLRGKFSGDVF